jgi:hypothetical protein
MSISDFRIIVLPILVCLTGATSARAGSPIYCSCQFEQGAGYSAVGTRAVCSTFTKEKACTIAFGGVGADGAAVSQLGIDPAKFRDQAFKLTMENLEAVQSNTPEKISNPAYLQEAVVVYMRAAYLRQGLEVDRATLVDLDKQVQGFSKEFAGQISEVFSSKRAPFSTRWQDDETLEIQKGAIRFVYRGKIEVVAVFF